MLHREIAASRQSLRTMNIVKLVLSAAVVSFCLGSQAQSRDWRNGIWHDPQVRYLLADMCLGGNLDMYRGYARDLDPDSREAIRLWDTGVRVLNTNEIQRCWVTNHFGKNGAVLRIVNRGSQRTISGAELALSNDGQFSQSEMRLVLLDLSLGRQAAFFEERAQTEPAVAEALRRWTNGCRVLNASWFSAQEGGAKPRQLRFKSSCLPADAALVRLNSDLPYSEVNVRYFLTDMYLGGSRNFYLGAAESAHEMACKEAVERYDSGVKVVNLDDFERKQVDGQTLITRKADNQRISGTEVRLSTD